MRQSPTRNDREQDPRSARERAEHEIFSAEDLVNLRAGGAERSEQNAFF